MSFPAQVFRILIASPSDVSEEREIAVKTIQEWNDANASERQIVLLPLRWETHSAPSYGKRPQEVINTQVVDHCDLLVGVFWTRVGSPTGASDSGTIEEIERVANAGKPVMLYFSNAKHDPDALDLEQLAKLREFKAKTFPKALIEHYSGAIEFKDKLAKQIDIQLRTILAARNESQPGVGFENPATGIELHFAEAIDGTDTGRSATVSTRYIEVSDLNAIPDYTGPKTDKASTIDTKTPSQASTLLSALQRSDFNRNYYRQRIASLVLKEFFVPLRFWLKNEGGIGARDIYIDLKFTSPQGDTVLISRPQLPSSIPSTSASGSGFLLSDKHPNSPDELIEKSSTGWSAHMEVPALQPQRELSPDTELFIGAKNSCTVSITATIFADTLATPSIQELNLEINVEKLSIDATQLLNEVILPTKG